MNARTPVRIYKPLCAILLLGILVVFPGCVGTLAQLIYTIKGHDIDPNYDGLEGKRIAVICLSDDSAYGPDTLTYILSNAVGTRLASKLPVGSEVISPARVEAWIDENGWNESEFVRLGEGIGAEKVVAIEVSSYSLKEGSTLYKGRCDVTVTVHDIEKDGQVPFVFGPEHYVFPRDARPAIQTTEREFEAFYLAQLTNVIANQFIVSDGRDLFASDGRIIR